MTIDNESFINPPSLDILIVDCPPPAQGGTDPPEVTPQISPPGLRHVGDAPTVALTEMST